MLTLQQASAILTRWGIRRFEILPHEFVPGSPERAMDRIVVENLRGDRFVLEQLSSEAFDSKTAIAARMDRLHCSGLCVSPYLKGENGHWIQRHNGFCWQLAPMIQGVALDRDRYWKQGWRGEAVGHFLADLAMAGRHWEPEGTVFSLPGYIEDLILRIERHAPQYLPDIEPIADYLRRRFYPMVEDVPPAFCHGDPHPVNTIWGKDRILAVIDWEFCGWKPLLYDAALVVGCVGAEAPEARNADFIAALTDTLTKRRAYPQEQMALLPLFVPAVRFGWLSEWLRRKDVQMIEFEFFYMRLLIASLDGDA
ncbi:MAG: aminoglycoside phosphotransferase family protein [Desulfobacteraceae bacterium]|jgi:homoserine kinase type II